MKTQEILSIVALALLGLCFLCGLAKMVMKKDSDKKNCDKACSMAIFASVVLVGVSQLLTETEKYTGGDPPSKLTTPGEPCYGCAAPGEVCEEIGGDGCSDSRQCEHAQWVCQAGSCPSEC